MAFTPNGVQGNSAYGADLFLQNTGIDPVVYGNNIQFNSLKTNALVQSSAVTDDPYKDQLIQPGREILRPFYDDLYAEVQDWSDGDNINVNGFTGGQERSIKVYQAQAFGFTDFAATVDMGDPEAQITSRFAPYWTRQNTTDVMGILKATFSNKDIAADNTYADDDDKEFNLVSFQKAKSLLGQFQNSAFSTLFVHPSVYAQMEAENYITVVGNDTPLSNAAEPITTYNGMRVIQDESLPIEDGVATSYIAGQGSIMYSAVAAKNGGMEYQRRADLAGGQTQIYSRRIVTGHVHGTTIAEGYTPLNGVSFTTRDLYNPDAWDCVVNPQYVHVVAYRSKVAPGYKDSLPDEAAIANGNKTATKARNSKRYANSSSASSSASTSTTASSSASSSSASK